MKDLSFQPYRETVCCLCGSSDRLTGEHKIKASALRREFAGEDMVLGNFSFDETGHGKYVQSYRSKVLHFSSRMCSVCNGSRTQPADLEFDRLHSLASRHIMNGEEPELAIISDRYVEGSVPYLNVFRFFAKLLCCQLAEVRAPRPVHMSNFAIGKNDRNCIWLRIGHDWTYQQFERHIGQHPYAAHGGLAVYANRRNNSPKAFHSTLTIGTLQYVFFFRLTWYERFALSTNHKEFYVWCRDRAAEGTTAPTSSITQLRLGVVTDD